MSSALSREQELRKEIMKAMITNPTKYDNTIDITINICSRFVDFILNGKKEVTCK